MFLYHFCQYYKNGEKMNQDTQTQTINLKPLFMLRNLLINSFVDRAEVVTAVIASVISGEPALLIGEPGTAKTAIVETLAKAIRGKYFYYLLTKFTEPDELIGPLDIAALKQGKYVRITRNKLPDADIVFLDEIFKASSAVRNILLDIILNRRFLNGDSYHTLPMLTLYTASNEISHDEEDMAFYDRLTIRVFAKPVSNTSWKELINKGLEMLMTNNDIEPVVDVKTIKSYQEVVKYRAYMARSNTKLLNKYIEALARLENKGVHLTDRRKIKTIIIASAISILYAEKNISLDSLADALLFTAVQDEDDINTINEVIMQTGLLSYMETIQRIQTIMTELKNAMNRVKETRNIDDFKNLQILYKEAVLELKRAPKTPRIMTYVKRMIKELEEVKSFIDDYINSLEAINF